MPRVSSIMKSVENRKQNKKNYEDVLAPERKKFNKYLEREEIEKSKDENTKRHERYRRKQMNTEGADLTSLIKPAKKEQKRPGTYFAGNLKKLGEMFDNDIGLIEKHFTLGQSSKYRPDHSTNIIFCNFTGKTLYNCTTGEYFE